MPPSSTEQPIVEVSPALLRDWSLRSWSSGNESKYERGRVLVVGGSTPTPGAVQLAGLAALRVGAGHLTLAVGEPLAVALAVATPEAGVYALPVNESGSVLGAGTAGLEQQLGSADAVLIGPGLDDIEQTTELLRWAIPKLGEETALVLDAYALGALPDVGVPLEPLAGRLVLTPNSTEAERLVDGTDSSDDEEVAVGTRIAAAYGAVVSSGGLVSHPDGRRWRVGAGHDGLATSGSGDVLAGALVGILAAGGEPEQAAVWATYVHAAAGDRLAARIGRLGFLAREIIDELPAVMVELDH